ncbi:MAG: cation:proton antiporter [Oscillospiraceae bacterium]|nr:cation:proton antiporter [Oscillospiraceae bacterium]
MYTWMQQFTDAAEVLISLSMILLSGFLLTRITKLLKLPNVTGFIFAGILIGPSVFDLVPPEIISGMSFISDIALAFIAFGVGKFFRRSVLKKTGLRIVVVTLFESVLSASAVVLAMRFVFRMDTGFSLLLGAIAGCTAPTSTMATIRQYNAQGPFVSILLQVVALDNMICLFVFSLVTSILGARSMGSVSAGYIVLPIVFNIVSVFAGILCGLLLSRLITPARSKDNRLIIVVAMLAGLSGMCAVMGISPLISCMAFGTAYINLTNDKVLYRQVNNFMPPVMSLFFIFSGMKLNLMYLEFIGLAGLSYFVFRIAGKYAGAYLGCLVIKAAEPIRNNLGWALIPQAGVAIGLAFLGARLLPPEIGDVFLALILSSSILYEIVGPISAKTALEQSGAIRNLKRPAKAEKTTGRTQ